MYFDLITPSDPFAHPTRPGHPERPHRLLAMHAALARLKHPSLRSVEAEPAPLSAAARLHDPRYLGELSKKFEPGEPPRDLDGGDTLLTPGALSAALTGLGGALGAVDRMAAGDALGAVLACRPPGHHATRTSAMGFCLLGTAALAAVHARDAYGLRVAVLDMDLHHGNGTEDLLADEMDVFFVSSQEEGIWPMSGAEGTSGRFGHLVNMSLPKGSGSALFRDRWAAALARVRDFAPDLIVISAGFDAHGNDPLSKLDVRLDDYAWMGREIAALAADVHARTLTIVEGGYDLAVLRDGLWRFLVPMIEAACGRSVLRGSGAITVPAPEASAYLAGRAPLMGKGPGRFACVKVNGRMWVQDQSTGALVYTTPDFLRLHSRAPLEDLARACNTADGIDVLALIELERAAKRVMGYSPATSPDYAA